MKASTGIGAQGECAASVFSALDAEEEPELTHTGMNPNSFAELREVCLIPAYSLWARRIILRLHGTMEGERWIKFLWHGLSQRSARCKVSVSGALSHLVSTPVHWSSHWWRFYILSASLNPHLTLPQAELWQWPPRQSLISPILLSFPIAPMQRVFKKF